MKKFENLRRKYDVNYVQIIKKNMRTHRSSHPEVFCKKGVLRNFTKFTGKHPCQSLFFNKVAGQRPQKK